MKKRIITVVLLSLLLTAVVSGFTFLETEIDFPLNI